MGTVSEEHQARYDEREPEDKSSHTFFIAGVQHHQYKSVFGDITEGNNLMLIPEPDNKFDPNAVQIFFDNFDKQAMLGFVPKKFSSEVSAMLEVGKRLECVLVEFNRDAKPWELFKVEIREIEDE